MTTGVELVDWPAERTLALSGSAARLKLPLAMRHGGAGVQPLGEVSLSELRPVGGGRPLRLDPVSSGLNLGDGVTRAQLKLGLDSATPPGRYVGQVRVGELTRTVSIEVLAERKLAIRPAPVVVDAAANRTHRFDVSFENRGNLPLTIDVTGEYPLGEEVPIPPRLADVGGSTQDRLAALLDTLVGREAASTLKPFGTAGLKQPGGPQPLAPGESRIIAVELALPDGLTQTARYHLLAPLYTADLHVVIVTAAKSAGPPKAARRTKGVAA
jgi:hypothetical protein